MSQSKQKTQSRNQSRKTKPARKSSQRSIFRAPVFWVVVVTLLVVTGMAGFFIQGRLQKTDLSPVSEITVQEAYQKYEQGVFLLDVREPAEWQETHIPKATLIPLGDLESQMIELPKDQEIVVICHSGNRSKQAVELLLSNGFSNVSSVSGGMNAWGAAGYPTVSGS